MQKSVIAVAICFLLSSAAWAQKPDEQGSQTQNKTKAAATTTVETHTYKGTLVDASCTGNTSQNTTTGANPAKDKPAKTSGTADRAANCTVSANTKEFALQTTDGKVLRFDSVGNQRAEEAVKNQKKWGAKASEGKAISAKAAGTLDGNNLTVVALD